MENECEALPGVAYPGVRDNRSNVNTKTGYDDDDDLLCFCGTDLVEKICYFEELHPVIKLRCGPVIGNWLA